MYLELNSIAIAPQSSTHAGPSTQVTSRIIVALAMSKCLQYLQHVHLRGFISSPPNNSYGCVPVFMSYPSCVSAISWCIVIRKPAEKPCSSPVLLSAVISLKPRLFTRLHPLMWNSFWHISCRCPVLFPSSCVIRILLGIVGKQRDQEELELNIDVYVSTSPLREYGQRC